MKASTFLLPGERTALARYGVALISVMMAFILRLAFDPFWGDRQAFATFYIAILVASWYGGLKPGLLTLALGYLLADWFFVSPRFVFTLLNPSFPELVNFAIYFTVGGSIAYVIESLQRSRRILWEATLEKQARHSELEGVIRNSPVPIWIAHDPECQEITGNPSATAMLGVAESTNVSQSVPARERVPLALRREGVELTPDQLPLQRAIATGHPVQESELELVRPNGRSIYVTGGAVPLFDAQGKVRGAIASLMDITEHKRAEAELVALKDRLDTELADMKRLHRLSIKLWKQNQIEPILRQVLEASMELLSADKGHVQLYDEREKGLKIVSQVGFSREFLDTFKSVPAGYSACGTALERRERVIVEDVFTDPHFADLAPIWSAHGFVAAQSTPLFSSAGKLFGMLSTHFHQPHRPSERELRMLDLYVQQAERVIERQRTEQRLAVQYALARVLADTENLREAAPQILRAVCETTNWKLGEIWRVDSNANVLRCVEIWSGVMDEVAQFTAISRESTFAEGIGLPGRVWARGAPAWIPDVTRDDNFPRAPFAAEAGLHGAFAFPIKHGEEVLGVIEFFSPEIREPDEEFLRLMAALGSQIGQFIQRENAENAVRRSEEQFRRIFEITKAQLQARIQERTEELVRSNQALETVNRALEAEIRERKELEREILEISEREQLRVGQDLHDGLSQLLRGIAYLSQILQENLAKRSLPEAQDATRVTQLLNEAVAQVRSLAKGLFPVKLEADGLVSALKELAASVENIFKISCRFECPSPVLIRDNAAATHLYRIAQEAVNNALRHGKASRIVMALTDSQGVVSLTIEDDGQGLPAEVEKGKGIGLKTMNYRARAIGGVLKLRRGPGCGARVTCSYKRSAPNP